MMSTAATEPAKSTAERTLTAVPVVLTVLATILAGLSSSEMTQSMYFRSLAAQDQAKAGSQWAFFQAKRIRGTTMENGGDLIRAMSDPPSMDAVKLRAGADRVESAVKRAGGPQELADAANRLRQIASRESVRRSLGYVTGPDLPAITEIRSQDGQIQELLTAIENRQTEKQTEERVVQLSSVRIDDALQHSEANAAAFDDACKPVTGDLKTTDRAVADVASEARKWRSAVANDADKRAAADDAVAASKEMALGLRAAKQDFTSRRYAKEATFNQESAELFELRARRTGAESDRHRTRSKNFFYAMLCAQAGVTLASFALARTRHSWFWAVAGTAGVIAIAFGAYVFVAY
jgi:hypothetical protein